MATPRQWVAAARPRTLPAAVSPVLAGTGAAAGLLHAAGQPAEGAGAVAVRMLLALLVALALQVGVNYANDYSDGIRGTDDVRVGPVRLTGARLATPPSVRRAAVVSFALAALAGLTLVAVSGAWWLIAVGGAAILAAWSYTGGPRPYGYLGLGELFVFVFFGLVAVLGTTYTQADRVDREAWFAAVGVGALACAILVANNLRDVPTDALAGKRTLAVRLGAPATRRLYPGLVALAFLTVAACAASRPWSLIALPAAGLAVRPIRTVISGGEGLALLPVLRDTGLLELAFSALLGIGLALGG